MSVWFLIDECLSPKLVSLAKGWGFAAEHVTEVRLATSPDELIAAFAVGREAILVTNNASDFRRIYRALPFHPGLVIILPSVRTPKQLLLFERIVSFLSDRPEPIDQLVEINAAGEITVRPWSSQTTRG